ncbi:MAG: response regulator [Candidatus Marinimicrobia bacterium]|nr:response regulator [Candidatus Neomarinimicrobiota bacterium]
MWRFITLIILGPLLLVAQPQEKIVFNHLNIKNGLSDGRIDCIIQDDVGFLWFGTQDGLNRFDGYNFLVYDHDIFDTTSISSSWIRCLCKDSEGTIWIGTEGGGLNRFNANTETFDRWLNDPNDTHSLIDNFVRTIIEDSYGVLWIGTRSGLVQLDRKKGIFNAFHSEPFNVNSPLFSENVTELYEDSKRNLWIGTQDNAYIYNRKNRSLKHLDFQDRPIRVTSIYEDRMGKIWIGSRYNGLLIFDSDKGSFEAITSDPAHSGSLGSNEIKDIFEDDEQNLWIATFQGGLNLYQRKTHSFQSYLNDPNDPSSLSSNSPRTLFQDRTGVIWIGMDGSGIDNFVKNRRIFQLYGNRNIDPWHLSNSTILSIHEDKNGILWLGTEGGGLNRFERGRHCLQYQRQDNRPQSISSDHVTCIYKGPAGQLWIGTKEGLNLFDLETSTFQRFYNQDNPITGNNFINAICHGVGNQLLLGTNNGLVVFDPVQKTFSPFELDTTGMINTEQVTVIARDKMENLWIGYLRSGFVKYNCKNGTWRHFRADINDKTSLSNNFVLDILPSGKNHIWIATRRGLNCYFPESNHFQQYSKGDGLPSNVIVSLLEDNDGNIWAGTTNGLSKFSREDNNFINYDVEDGLQGNQFWSRSCFKSQSGELFFGGNNGLNAFYPDRLKELSNPYIPPIVITGITVMDRQLHPSLFTGNSTKNPLVLPYNENRVSFEFAALDFTRPEKNQFAFILEGIDDDWVHSSTRHFATYPNLSPGQYVFRVKGANNDGLWNEAGTAVALEIQAPFWKTGWAYLLYGLFAIGLVYSINAYFIGLVRARHDLKIERMEKEKFQEISQFKLQFFTDVAHEFKTPLTLIQAPLEEILSSLKEDFSFRSELQLMHRNVKYLLRLVHQLLSFRKVEQQRMELKASQGNLVQFVREIFALFSETSQRRKVGYEFNCAKEVIEGWFDWEKLEEILVNLIDNAFKYTPDEGKIEISLTTGYNPEKSKNQVTLTVRDSGKGIKKEELDHIFERFYHAKDHQADQGSSGLGLALTRKLVELHHGTIDINSEEGKGAIFTVQLPLGKEHLKPEEIISDITETAHFHILSGPHTEDPESQSPDTASDSDPEKTRLLVVEDNRDLRTYLHKALGKKYHIITACDGKEGIETARRVLPNIIISDVMMPIIDGIELCRTLKQDITTSHIPIILLTAKTAIEHKIQGIETGADDYIDKPFHFRFLEARIKNILESREKLRQRYRQELILEPGEVKAHSADELFIVKIRELVEQNIDNADFDLTDLQKEIGMGRTHLFQKLKELTGYTPNDFIKTLRMEKAAQLLLKTDLTISEIAYKVGFRYPKYFSTCFSQYHRQSPSEYRKYST